MTLGIKRPLVMEAEADWLRHAKRFVFVTALGYLAAAALR
jgi:hypothetical protein